MIAVDTSAIIAIALREPDWEDSFSALSREPDIVMSAVTMAEILIVAARREVVSDMPAFLAAPSSDHHTGGRRYRPAD